MKFHMCQYAVHGGYFEVSLVWPTKLTKINQAATLLTNRTNPMS
jgi:hypothetical protein